MNPAPTSQTKAIPQEVRQVERVTLAPRSTFPTHDPGYNTPQNNNINPPLFFPLDHELDEFIPAIQQLSESEALRIFNEMHDRTSILFDYIFAQKAKSRNWQLQGFKIHPGQKLNMLGVAKEATSAMRCFASTLHMADEEIRNMSKDCVMRVVEATGNFFFMSPYEKNIYNIQDLFMKK